MNDVTPDDGADRPVVVRLHSSCTTQEVSTGEYYHATVNGVVDYGIFVDISEHVSGLVHESTFDGGESFEVGDEIVVHLAEVRDNGDLSFELADLDEYDTVEREHSYERSAAATVGERVGDTVHIEGEVVQIKQTGGPTIFRVRDDTSAVPCTAFEEAGVRAHPTSRSVTSST